MPGLFVHRSNRLEALVDRLGEILRVPLPDPFQAEKIVVQSLGMRRWLALSLASRLGISMNCEFPFPDTLARNLFNAAFPELPNEPAFDRDVLPWRIFSILPKLLGTPGFAPLEHYVGAGDLSAIKRFQLSNRLAILFDRHLAYRPGKLLEWERVPSADWQATLWRELTAGHSQSHPPALLERYIAAVAGEAMPLPAIPPRVSLFGISSLPPFHIHLVDALAKCVDLHLFLFEPTDQYWGDILSPREQQGFLRKHAKGDQSPADFHLESGNALLASLGRPGRVFTRAIQDLDPAESEELFTAPSGATLLSKVQKDIFNLQEQENGERQLIELSDRTIQVHCCHGPMRELEVLHDQLLDFFQTRPGLTPKDVLVMMPDVERFAPFIEAVFGTPDDESHHIPFTIADRSAKAENKIAQTFLQLLSLHGSRFGAAAVLSLLDSAPLRRRFDLSEDDLDTIRNWIASTGIRWGIDGLHRAEFGLPPFTQNSWRAGLDRLLLGYALSSEEPRLFQQIYPAEGIEGRLAEILGNFTDFAEKLFTLIPTLSSPRTLDDWAQTLRNIHRTFLDDSDEFAEETQEVRMTLDALGKLVNAHPGPVPFEIVRSHLLQSFATTDSGRGFLVGRVTFCSLKPMRSIPFRVICMLGMGDGAFPRRDPDGLLDALAKAGDVGRSRRDEDRQVFLEAILSAREILLLSYSGLSSADNSESPPSVVVSELLDYLDANFSRGDAASIRDWIVTHHRLQAFSSSYFSGDDRLFSYSMDNFGASLTATGPRSSAPLPIDGALPEPGPEWRLVDLTVLQRFFRNPAKVFLKGRMGITLPDSTDLIEESEPMSFSGLSRWNSQQGLTTSMLRGQTGEANLETIQASGTLPGGYAGEACLNQMSTATGNLVARVRAVVTDAPLAPIPFRLEFGEWSLSGTLADVHRIGLVRTISWTLSAKDRIRAWIDHLVLNALSLPDSGRETRVFTTNATLAFKPVSDPGKHLEVLLAIYKDGLCRPAPFFPQSSFEFARRTLQPGKQERTSPVLSARKLWENDERDDPYTDLCFRNVDPLDANWQELALQVLQPMIEHSTEEKM